MDFHTTAKYPAPLDEVLKMLTSEEFQRVRLADLPVTVKSIVIREVPDSGPASSATGGPASNAGAPANYAGAPADNVAPASDAKPKKVSVTTQVHAKPADLNLPSMADKFVPRAGVTVAMTETWNIETAESVLTVDSGGLPVNVAATSKLVDEGGAVTRKVEGSVTVSVPLFGKKLEQRAVQEMNAIVRAEETAAQKYLAN
ncbi:MAG: DUF2505 domain-containing protein [Acidobacteriota bacterium]|nr:DUF2505 domain-containing protein [Acidobacteriota bacterium]